MLSSDGLYGEESLGNGQKRAVLSAFTEKMKYN